jgi:hypothetical protein
MKRLFAGSIGLALFVAVTSVATAQTQSYASGSIGSPGSSISVTYFYDNLSPYGEWFQQPQYGWCWTPYDTPADWRPYRDGHWEYTDYGWSWVSDESWGWAPYHYGRWFFDDSYGWAWVPGTEWAPAWVAWRYADDYVGWAPLPPDAGWDASAGLRYSYAERIPSQEWCFVPRDRVFDVSLRIQVTSVARNITLFARSRDATRYEVRDGRPANLGFDVAEFERSTGRHVQRVKIVDVATPTQGSGRPAGNGGVGFYRPRVDPTPPGQAFVPTAVERRTAIPDGVMQRARVEEQRKLESDLNAERARLAREQQNELRKRPPGLAAEELRKNHAAEQQAFEAHAAQQRQVQAHRLEKQVMRPERNPGPPDKGKDNGKSDNPGKGKGRDKGGK